MAHARTTPHTHQNIALQGHSFISGYKTVHVCVQWVTVITAKDANLAANAQRKQSVETYFGPDAKCT